MVIDALKQTTLQKVRIGAVSGNWYSMHTRSPKDDCTDMDGAEYINHNEVTLPELKSRMRHAGYLAALMLDNNFDTPDKVRDFIHKHLLKPRRAHRGGLDAP